MSHLCSGRLTSLEIVLDHAEDCADNRGELVETHGQDEGKCKHGPGSPVVHLGSKDLWSMALRVARRQCLMTDSHLHHWAFIILGAAHPINPGVQHSFFLGLTEEGLEGSKLKIREGIDVGLERVRATPRQLQGRFTFM